MKPTLRRLAATEIDASGLKSLDGSDFFVTVGEVELPCRLKLLPGATRLFVTLNGAVDRTKYSLPAFARWNWGKVLGGHVLSVCDPTLFLDDELRLGWFVGNLGMNPMIALRRTAETVREVLGIAAGEMAFYGSSGGGFAAIIGACGLPHGRAIAVNPQTDITRYFAPAVANVARVFAPGWTPQRCRDHYPLRWSALAAIDDSRLARRDLRILYVQNLADKAHHARHFLPFCEQFDAPTTGGLSKDMTILTHVYDSSEGHGPEPPEVVKHIVSHGLPHLFPTAARDGEHG